MYNRQQDIKQTKGQINEWIKGMAREKPEWMKNRRMEYLFKEGLRLVETQMIFIAFNTVDDLTERGIRRIVYEMNQWIKPEDIRPSRINDHDIEMANNVGVEQFVPIHGRRNFGGRQYTICPFHDDTHPSLVIYPAGKGYHCFVCTAHGSTIDFVMKTMEMKFVEAVKFIINK